MITVTPLNLFGDDSDDGGDNRHATAEALPRDGERVADDRRSAMNGPVPGLESEAPQYPATPTKEGATEPAIESPPQAKGLLSKKQKVALGMLSRRAWEHLAEHGALDKAEEKLNPWRHAEVSKATNGQAGRLGEATDRQFRQIRGHFLHLLGEDDGAFLDAMRDQPGRSDWELAWYKLKEACRKWEYAWPGYPESVCRNQYRCGIEDATTKQMWALFYTVTNRGRTRAKEAKRKAELGIEN